MTLEVRPPNTPSTAVAEITDKQREKFLDLLRKNRVLGTIAALRQAGVEGRRAELRRLLDADDGELAEQARQARGHNIHEVEDVLWTVAKDKDHPSWERAAGRLLKAYDAKFRDNAHVEHEHTGQVEVTNTDVAAAIDRFTGQIVRLAARNRAALPPGEPGS